MKRFLLLLAGGFFLSSFTVQAQWLPATAGLPVMSGPGVAMDASDSSAVVVACINRIDLSTDGGFTWKTILTSSSAPNGEIFNDVALVDKDHIWVAGGTGHILTTQDGGDHWVTQYYDAAKTNMINYIHFFDLQHGIAMGDGFNDVAAILRTHDGGSTWQSVNTQAFGAFSGDLWRRLDFINTETGYFYASGMNPQKLRRTDDNGATWNATPGQLPYVQVLNFYNRNLGLAIADAGRIFRTVDAAASWQEFHSPHTGWGCDIEFSPSDPALVWVTDKKQVFFSSDTGKTWAVQFDKGGNDLEFTSSNLGWLWGDNGALYHTINGNSNKTLVRESVSIPAAFELGQNYPNPFNATTKITYSCATPSRVRITVHTVLGQTIATLVDQDVASGAQVTNWEADVAAGIYFYRIDAVSLNNPKDRYSDVKRMLLIK